MVLAVVATALQAAPRHSGTQRPAELIGGRAAPASRGSVPDGTRVPAWAPAEGIEAAQRAQRPRPDAAPAPPTGPPERHEGGPLTAHVRAVDQRGTGDELVVAEVAATGTPTIAVVRDDLNGRPGRILGHRALEAGEHRNVMIAFDVPLAVSGVVWVTLHADTAPTGELTFPDGDPPLRIVGAATLARFAYEVTS